MFGRLDALQEDLQGIVGGLEPEVLETETAAGLVERFTRIENIAAAGKALAAARVAASGAWRSSGERSPAHWLARTTGTSVGSAAGVIETGERAGELAQTSQALRRGELSQDQARHIASAAAACPSSETELLQAARRQSLSGLRNECDRVRAAALPSETERYEKVRSRRRLRHWSDPGGAFRLDALLTPDAGAVVLAALEPLQEQMFTQARRQGRRDSYEAYGADALVAIAEHVRDCEQQPERRGPASLVHVLVDHAALVRGGTEAGETCEIAGVGPVPVATAQALASDAILSVLVTDGSDIKKVCHRGRTISARQRTALVARDRTCVVPGCDVRSPLQIDHNIPVHEHGPGKLDNLARLCVYHHYLKTHRGYRLSGGPGDWRWDPPERPPDGRPTGAGPPRVGHDGSAHDGCAHAHRSSAGTSVADSRQRDPRRTDPPGGTSHTQCGRPVQPPSGRHA